MLHFYTAFNLIRIHLESLVAWFSYKSRELIWASAITKKNRVLEMRIN
jgi:hypothetical protein